jgi:hypothetical protein
MHPDPEPIHPIHANPLPINCTPAAHIPANPDPDDATANTTRSVFASTSPAQPIYVDTVPVRSKLTPVDLFIKSLPVDSVPVDPIRITPVKPVFTFITLSGIKHACRTVKNHLYSVSLTYVGVFAVF